MTAATSYAESDEHRAVDAVLAFAARQQHGECRADPALPFGFDDPEADDLVGLFLAAEHGIDATRVSAYKSLGASRGLPLGDVLRAAFRNELRQVVELPAVEHKRRGAAARKIPDFPNTDEGN